MTCDTIAFNSVPVIKARCGGHHYHSGHVLLRSLLLRLRRLPPLRPDRPGDRRLWTRGRLGVVSGRSSRGRAPSGAPLIVVQSCVEKKARFALFLVSQRRTKGSCTRRFFFECLLCHRLVRGLSEGLSKGLSEQGIEQSFFPPNWFGGFSLG